MGSEGDGLPHGRAPAWRPKNGRTAVRDNGWLAARYEGHTPCAPYDNRNASRILMTPFLKRFTRWPFGPKPEAGWTWELPPTSTSIVAEGAQ